MEEVHGKEISLQYVTVKVPGQKPRGSKTITNSSITKGTKPSNSDSSDVQPITNYQTKDKKCSDKVLLTGYELIKEPGVKNEDEKVRLSFITKQFWDLPSPLFHLEVKELYDIIFYVFSSKIIGITIEAMQCSKGD